MNEKIKHFAALLESDLIYSLLDRDLACDANISDSKVYVRPGKKYTKVDIGGSGRYMIDTDGTIYGIKAYGVIHKGHRYGTLDTVGNYYWGEYVGYSKRAEKHNRPLLTVEQVLEARAEEKQTPSNIIRVDFRARKVV